MWWIWLNLASGVCLCLHVCHCVRGSCHTWFLCLCCSMFLIIRPLGISGSTRVMWIYILPFVSHDWLELIYLLFELEDVMFIFDCVINLLLTVTVSDIKSRHKHLFSCFSRKLFSSWCMLCGALQLVWLIYWVWNIFKEVLFMASLFPPQRENFCFILVSSKSSFSLPPQSMSNLLVQAHSCSWNEESSDEKAAAFWLKMVLLSFTEAIRSITFDLIISGCSF